MAATHSFWTSLGTTALSFALAGALGACGDIDDPVEGADASVPPTVVDTPVPDGYDYEDDVQLADAGAPDAATGGDGADAGAGGDAGDHGAPDGGSDDTGSDHEHDDHPADECPA